jgi:hypothetical protein
MAVLTEQIYIRHLTHALCKAAFNSKIEEILLFLWSVEKTALDRMLETLIQTSKENFISRKTPMIYGVLSNKNAQNEDTYATR